MSWTDSRGTRHVLAPGVEGETTDETFRRLARDKPPTLVPCKGCADCGADHRGPIELWPEEERRAHEAATA